MMKHYNLHSFTMRLFLLAKLLQQDLEAVARVAAHIAISLRTNEYMRTQQPKAF